MPPRHFSNENRQRLVQAALKLFCQRGFAAVGTQEICQEAGVLKGTLYHFFPTKIDLAIEALRHYGEAFRVRLDELAARDESPSSLVRALFAMVESDAKQCFDKNGFVSGCLHGNLAMELSTTEPRVRDILNHVTNTWVTALAPVLAAAGCQPPEPAARRLLAYLHGVVLLAKSANSPGLVSEMAPNALAWCDPDAFQTNMHLAEKPTPPTKSKKALVRKMTTG